MRRGIIGLLFLVVLVSGMCGCRKRSEENESTPTPIPTQIMENLFMPVEEDVLDINEIGGIQLNTEKKDASDLAEYNVVNQKMEGMLSPSLFCVDGLTGVKYFVNQNKDWYIYAIEGEESELAVALPARELTLWEGKVYFMLGDYGIYELEGMNVGDIYVYTPEEGSVKLVYEASRLMIENYYNSAELAVNENGIYFRCVTGVESVKYSGKAVNVLETKEFYLAFGATEAVENNVDMTTPGWGEYRFLGGMNVELISREDGVDSKKEIGIQTSDCAIMRDELYYRNDWEVGSINLVTGEKMNYQMKEFIEESLNLSEEGKILEVGKMTDFTLTKEHIWVLSSGKYLISVNRQSGEMTCYVVSGDMHMLEKLYTDGEQIYGIYTGLYGTGTMSELVKILADKEPEWNEYFNLPMLEVEALVE